MKKALLSKKEGFTLLEVLIALTILTIGLLGLAEMTLSVIAGNAVGDKMTDARVLAEDKMEEFRMLSLTDAQLTDDGNAGDIITDITSDTTLFTSPDHTDTCNSGCSAALGLTPQRVWNVADDTPAAGMKTVTVIVGWNNKINYFIALSTVLSN